MERKIGLEKFKMFFAVHEIEAWLLCQPELFPSQIQKQLRTKAGDRPEGVDMDEPPGKLLEHLYSKELKTKYKKTVDGKKFFSQLDPQIAHDKCPYLAQMLDEMLNMANTALS